MAGAGLLLIIVAAILLSQDKPVSYSAEVKPILNKHCISCHGGVTAKSGFSLLFREDALLPAKSGRPAIVPGNPGASEMIRRLTTKDPEQRMPYQHEPLADNEIDILKRWIKQGAKFETHWAYTTVGKSEPPAMEDPWIKTDIDRYIREACMQQELENAPEAPAAVLLRRVSLDLIGMYPDSAMAARFLQASNREVAWQQLVDSLLASPHFGERWASVWLDIARYADTKGYESDGNRNIWRYRDWVIKAFNADMPYDEFLTRQIAGDLLSDAGTDEWLATAFHRNTMTNDEGGTLNEEFRVAAVLDRVNTTWEGIMGTTFACVQCHSHPYDPFRHEDYYRFMAYFNNTRDEDVPPEYPLLRHFSETQADSVRQVVAWVKEHAGEREAQRIKKLLHTGQPAYHSSYADALRNCVIGNNNWALFMRNHAIARMNNLYFDTANQIILRFNSKTAGGNLQLRLDSANGHLLASIPIKADKKFDNHWVTIPTTTGLHHLYLVYDHPAAAKPDEPFQLFFDWIYVGRNLPAPEYAGHAPASMEAMFRTLLDTQVEGTPVIVENPAAASRKSFVFERGAWTAHGKAVEPGVPKILAMAMPSQAPANRLGLTQWLTDMRHPLVSRTLVNRLWEQIMGRGLVETLEDMGSQGAAPSHAALLDYMAWNLMHTHQWSIKKLLREMVLSACYRQQSTTNALQLQQDPHNKWLARGPRKRLQAEQIRDQALCISGTLNARQFGAPVMPWQPDGIWQSPYNGATWQLSDSAEQYRRAIYTYWKRSSPYPSLMTFDAAQRVVCNARRIATNTPLQALVTMNDSVYVDLARRFARRMQRRGGEFAAQIQYGYNFMSFSTIPPAKLQVLEQLYQQAKKEYEAHPYRVAAMLGKSQKGNASDAAMVVVANAMLNLDEIIMNN